MQHAIQKKEPQLLITHCTTQLEHDELKAEFKQICETYAITVPELCEKEEDCCDKATD